MAGVHRNGGSLEEFFSITTFDDFRGGPFVATGDTDGDGIPDLAISPDASGGRRGRLFRGGPRFRSGAFLTGGDFDGDGFAAPIFGAWPGGAPRVRSFSGKALLGGSLVDGINFFAGSTNDRSGVQVSVKDIDGDEIADLATTLGPVSPATVRYYLGGLVQPNGELPLLTELNFADQFDGGVFVG